MGPDEKEKQRELSEDERERLLRFEQLSEEMAREGYQSEELTIGIVRANVLTLLMAVPIFALGIFLFFRVNDGISLTLTGHGMVLLLGLYLVLVVVHELVHGLTWSLFTENHLKDVAFGFMKKYLTPYCSCKVPMRKGPYLLGALMPLILLGLLPTALAIAKGNTLWLILGLIMILSAGGDILIAAKVAGYRGQGKETLFLDHPTQAGCVVFTRQTP